MVDASITSLLIFEVSAVHVLLELAAHLGPDTAAEDGTAVDSTAEDVTAGDGTVELSKKVGR